MSDPITTYLARVESALWLKRRARREVIEELRGHIEALDPPAASVADLSERFGEPTSLARRIARERPWWQTTAPWRPTVYLFAYVLVGITAICALNWDSRHPSPSDAIWWSFAIAVTYAAARVARMGAHPVHAVLTGMRPALLLSLLFFYATAKVGFPSQIGASLGAFFAQLLLMSFALALAPTIAVRRGHGRIAAAMTLPPLAFLASLALWWEIGVRSQLPQPVNAIAMTLAFAVLGWASTRFVSSQAGAAVAVA